MEIAAVTAVGLLTVVTLFQFALALGVPWGRAAWGGTHPGRLPRGFRVASGVGAVVVYPLIMFVVLTAADMSGVDWDRDVRRTVLWVLAGVFVFGALANAASRSKIERIWSPVSLGVAVCCAVMARLV